MAWQATSSGPPPPLGGESEEGLHQSQSWPDTLNCPPMLRRSWPALILLLWASPAWAVREWYDHYLDARDRLMPAGNYAEALTELQAAVRLKSASAMNEQTYGLQFIDYLPYYHLGVCYLRLGDLNSATRYFN